MTVAVVTGGASGFGLALAASLSRHGFDVAIADLDGERAATEAATLSSATGATVIGFTCDVSNPASVDATASQVHASLGGTDLLISNVGVQRFGAAEHLSDDAWRWVLDVNVIGSVRVLRAFLPLLRSSPHGRVAFTASASVLDPAARLAAYQASKFALWGLAESLRIELAPDGIDVSVIFPSGMITRHLESSEAAQPAALRDVGAADDLDVMIASNPAMAAAIATAEDAAAGVVEAVLAGDEYVITHGDLVLPIERRHAALIGAATRGVA